MTARSRSHRACGAFVQPEDRDQSLEPAELAPVEQRRGVDSPVHRPECALERCHGPRVAGGLGILDEDLCCQDLAPEIVAWLGVGAGRRNHRARAQPAILVLVGDDEIEIAVDSGFELGVIEKIGQRDKAVEPVGCTLPRLGASTEPLAVADIGPELIQVAADAIGLDPELSGKPALRSDGAQGEGTKGRLLKRGMVHWDLLQATTVTGVPLPGSAFVVPST